MCIMFNQLVDFRKPQYVRKRVIHIFLFFLDWSPRLQRKPRHRPQRPGPRHQMEPFQR